MQKLKVPRYIQWLVLLLLIFLVLMSLLRLGLVLKFKPHMPFAALLPSFALGLRYDLRMIGIAIMLLFLIGSIKFLHPFQTKAGYRLAFALWSVFCFVFCLFYVLDFAHFDYLSQRLNGSILNYLDDARISVSMIWQSYHVVWLILILLAGFSLLMWLIRSVYNHILSKRPQSNRRSRIAWGVTLFLLLALAIFGRVGQYPLRWSDAFTLGNEYKSQVALNPFQSFFSSLSYRHLTFDSAQVKAHYDWLANFLEVQHPDKNRLNFERVVTGDLSANKPNVVLVICESFSAYKSSMVGNPLNTTPFFNKMVQGGIYFDRCFSPSYGTARGVWAVVTGIPDVQLSKTASRNPAAVDQHTIIDDLDGYEKYYFLGGSTSWANIRGLLTNNISSLHLYEQEDFKAAKVDVWGISDKNLLLEANKILAPQPKPFFAIIQTADNHRPYTIPEEDLQAFKKQKVPDDSLHKYGFASLDEYNAFRYTDFCFEQFMNAARKEKYFDNTIFVFIGDHGIGGSAGNMLPKAFTEQALTQEHIPLLLYAPKMLQPARHSFVASQIDVLPTIAGLLKVNYRNTTLGRDLLKAGIEKKNGGFIIDIDNRRIGMLHNDLYYNYTLNSNKESITSIADDAPVEISDSVRKTYRFMTDAFYETSRYLLLNNKKRKQ